MDLHERYTKEVMCCEDLTIEICMHIQKGNFELVDARMKDLQISVDQLKQMEQQKRDRINLKRIVWELNRKGILKKWLDKALVYEEGQKPTLEDYIWLLLPYIASIFVLVSLLIILR